MGNPALSALSFIIETAFSLYIMVVALRFIMQLVKADYYNPLAQFVVKVTNPLLVPLRKIVPGFGKMDLSALVLGFLLILAKLLIFKGLGLGYLNIAGYTIATAHLTLVTALGVALVDLIALLFNIFMFSIVILALISWINPQPGNPVVAVLGSITAPVLRPFRQRIPPISGIDLSPLAAIVTLQVAKMLIIPTLLGLFA